jgi:hypothetical protein
MRHIRARLAKIGISRDKFLLRASAFKGASESRIDRPAAAAATEQAFGRRAGI